MNETLKEEMNFNRNIKTMLEQKNRRIWVFIKTDITKRKRNCFEKRKSRMKECVNLMIRENFALKYCKHRRSESEFSVPNLTEASKIA